ncbi:hypothetical protein KHC23_08635 [Ancylobacter dichloromethanicus]|uniref:Phage tail protein (Tail_P2_I) n=1 Tax=Ancylobacter dichloromethanicus TaxID=518825 RepID=A0A9W6JFN1_9HYPH|nr:phage tail protein [Ancylobacter dichloromethanicus]MBS7553715.1 hypothetical protein [Ancylobacter dichloromethanicus]GLK74678.1 hypothetical protein GCM10017643_47970 [Ancylobacter dichloromethanicus]
MSAHDAAQLLPTSAHVYERTLARAVDTTDVVGPSIDALHGLKILNPPASFLPYLVWEYGLGMLSPYVPNLYDLIREGVDWQRVRGTPAAVDMALGWVGYEAAIEYAPVRRRWWNCCQLGLDRVRDDEADLIRIDGLTWLSIPLRSDFWRAYAGYDVRALEYSEGRWSEAMWSDDSGVVIDGARAKWSFGRRVDIVHDITAEDLAALGIPDPWALEVDGEPLTLDGEPLRFVPTEADLTWGDLTWGDFSWAGEATQAVSASLLAATGAGPAWAAFKDAAGEVLFYRRARVRRAVVAATGGVYAVGASRFSPATGLATDLYIEAMTDFGEGFGSVAASVGFVLSAHPAAGCKPGLAHLEPGELEPAGPIIAEVPVTIEFGRTVRERVACLLRF